MVFLIIISTLASITSFLDITETCPKVTAFNQNNYSNLPFWDVNY
jgi:hypothetical protein